MLRKKKRMAVILNPMVELMKKGYTGVVEQYCRSAPVRLQ